MSARFSVKRIKVKVRWFEGDDDDAPGWVPFIEDRPGYLSFTQRFDTVSEAVANTCRLAAWAVDTERAMSA